MPEKNNWPNLIKRDGDKLFDHYRHTLEALGNQKGHARTDLQQVAEQVPGSGQAAAAGGRSHRQGQWVSMSADVKGDAKNAQDTKSGAGQYFTPRR